MYQINILINSFSIFPLYANDVMNNKYQIIYEMNYPRNLNVDTFKLFLSIYIINGIPKQNLYYVPL